MSSIQGSSSNLAQAARTLAIEWENTKAYWRDAKSEEFERQYLTELPGHVASAVAAIEEIDTLLKRVRSDCE
jgi:hypothetical protein